MLASVPEAFMFSESLDAINISELHHRGFLDISVHEGDVEGHHGMDRVGGELKRDYVEVI